MAKAAQHAHLRPVDTEDSDQKVLEHYKAELEATCRRVFLDGTSSTSGLEGHQAEKAARQVAIALFINRLQLDTRKTTAWTLALPDESDFKLSISRPPQYDDFQCVLSILETIRERSSKCSPRLTVEENNARNAQLVKEAVKQALLQGDEDRILKPVPEELAELAATLASQSPLVRRFGIYRNSAYWNFTLPDQAEFKIEFSRTPDSTDLDCAIDVIKIVQKRYESTGPVDRG